MSNLKSIFISYRRADSISDSGRIHDYLEHHFGRKNVFMDVDSIPLGVNFREFLEQQMRSCRILIAIIGPNWLTAVDDEGKRKLDDPNDWVRLEIETALRREISIIPLLVSGAKMPSSANLPEGLKSLSDWQSICIRPNPDFRRDTEKLINGIENLFNRSEISQKFDKPSPESSYHTNVATQSKQYSDHTFQHGMDASRDGMQVLFRWLSQINGPGC